MQGTLTPQQYMVSTQGGLLCQGVTPAYSGDSCSHPRSCGSAHQPPRKAQCPHERSAGQYCGCCRSCQRTVRMPSAASAGPAAGEAACAALACAQPAGLLLPPDPAPIRLWRCWDPGRSGCPQLGTGSRCWPHFCISGANHCKRRHSEHQSDTQWRVASSTAHEQRFSQPDLGAGGWQRVDNGAVEPQPRRPEVQGPDIRHAAPLHQQLLHGLQLLPDGIPQADHRQAAQGLCLRHVPKDVQQQRRPLQLERSTWKGTKAAERNLGTGSTKVPLGGLYSGLAQAGERQVS